MHHCLSRESRSCCAAGCAVALLREIHETHPELPVIIATAFLSIEPQLQLLDVPYTDYIVKPFRLDELGARIDAAI